VADDTAPDYRLFVFTAGLYDVSFRQGRCTAEAAPTLPVGAALFMIFLLSLGLWGTVWLTTYSLAWL
jgi:hypothetical protein